MRLSVIVATHNRRDLLLCALDSVKAQTLPPHEVIVVADGCQDDTTRHVRRKHPDVVLIEQSNTGLAVARNTALAQATGDWIAFLDDDDVWDPNKVERLTAFTRAHPQAEALYHPVWTLQAGVRGGPVHTEDFAGQGVRRLLLGVPSVPSALAIRRSMALRVGGFPPHVAYGEDWIFVVNVGRLTEWRLVPEPLATVRWDGERMSSSASWRPQTHFLAAPVSLWSGRAYNDLAPSLREDYRRLFREGMQETLRQRRWREARTMYAWLAVVLPRHIDRLYLVAPTSVLRCLRAAALVLRRGP